MAEEGQHEQENEARHLPPVLILQQIGFLAHLEEIRSNKFRLVKAWESLMPLDVFLTIHPQSVRALLCSGKTPVTSGLLQHLPSLQCVVTTSAGVNHIDLAECQRRSITIANAGRVFSEDVADCAVGLLLDLLRRISAADRYIRGGLWPVKGEYPLGSVVISISMQSV